MALQYLSVVANPGLTGTWPGTWGGLTALQHLHASDTLISGGCGCAGVAGGMLPALCGRQPRLRSPGWLAGWLVTPPSRRCCENPRHAPRGMELAGGHPLHRSPPQRVAAELTKCVARLERNGGAGTPRSVMGQHGVICRCALIGCARAALAAGQCCRLAIWNRTRLQGGGPSTGRLLTPPPTCMHRRPPAVDVVFRRGGHALTPYAAARRQRMGRPA